MSKIKKLLIVFSVVFGLLVVAAIVFFALKPKVAGVYIDSDPSSLVFINGEEVGKTPYRGTRDPEEVLLKLSASNGLGGSYETRIALLPGVETVVKRVFGKSEDFSSGEIISFEKIAKDETSLAIVSIPDSAEVTIDGSAKAFTPHKTSALAEGDHTLLLTAKGYEDKTVRVKTHKGYKLTAIVTLAKREGGTVIATPTPTPTPTIVQTSELVQISQIAGGILRVRKEPRTGSEEVGQVESGKSYPYLDKDTVTGWFKIEFEAGKDGWISSQYAKKIANPNVTGTPVVSPTPSRMTTPKPTALPSAAVPTG